MSALDRFLRAERRILRIRKFLLWLPFSPLWFMAKRAGLHKLNASTRMHWYAVLNHWETPAALPKGIVEDNFEPCRDFRKRFPKWTALLDAVRATLNDDQVSWGWWREQKIGNFNQWTYWIQRERNRWPTIDESGERVRAWP